MSETCRVILTGEVAEGMALDQVKANVGKLFKLDTGQLEKLFAGGPVVVRKGVEPEQAEKICAGLVRAGAIAVVKPDPSPAVAAPAAASQSAGDRQGETEGFTPDLECPRCGHQQPFATACRHCKMDLTLHIKRLQRKQQARAFRRANRAAD